MHFCQVYRSKKYQVLSFSHWNLILAPREHKVYWSTSLCTDVQEPEGKDAPVLLVVSPRSQELPRQTKVRGPTSN